METANSHTANAVSKPAKAGHTRNKSQSNASVPADIAEISIEGQAVDASVAKKRGRAHYASRACGTCRRRKLRCDAQQPSCSTCQQYGEQCSYTDGIDARRPTSKHHVAALQERIAVLEALVAELQAQLPAGSQQQPRISVVAPDVKPFISDYLRPAHNQDNRQGKSIRRTLSNDQDYSSLLYDVGLDRLKLDPDSKELVQYGVTAPFRHAVDGASSGRTRFASPDSSTSNDFQEDGRVWLKNFPAGLDDWDDDLHAALLDLFFRHHNDFYCFVDEAAFRADMELCLSSPASGKPAPPTRTANYSALLHCGMMMQAGWLSTDPRTNEDSLEGFLKHALNLIPEEGDRPTLSTVQGIILLGNAETCCGRPGLGYLFGGIAIRMSTTLALGVDCTAYVRSGVLTKQAQDARVRTQWACFLMDKLWSSYVGRTPTLPAGEVAVPAIDPAVDAIPWKTSSVLTKPIPGWTSSTHHHKIKLTLLQDRVMHAVYDTRTDVYATSTQMAVTEINLALEEWMAQLPDSIRIMPQTTTPPPPHVTILNMFWHFVLILLHRPYYFPRKGQPEAPVNEAAFKRCNSSAARIVSLLNLFARSPGLPMSPIIIVQFAFVAGTTHLLALANADAQRSVKRATDARKNVAVCMSILSAVGHSCRTGVMCADILSKMLNNFNLNGQSQGPSVAPREEDAEQPQTVVSDTSDASPVERTDLATAGGLFSAPVPPTALGYLRLQPLPGIDDRAQTSGTSAQIEELLKRSSGNFANLNPSQPGTTQPFTNLLPKAAPMWSSTPSPASAPLPFDATYQSKPFLANPGPPSLSSGVASSAWPFFVPQMGASAGNRINAFGQPLPTPKLEETRPAWPSTDHKPSTGALQSSTSQQYAQSTFNPAGGLSLSSFALGPLQALHPLPLSSAHPSGLTQGSFASVNGGLKPPNVTPQTQSGRQTSTKTPWPLSDMPSETFNYNTWVGGYTDAPGVERFDNNATANRADHLIMPTVPTTQWQDNHSPWYASRMLIEDDSSM